MLSCNLPGSECCSLQPHSKKLERYEMDIFGLEINAASHAVMSILFTSGFMFGCLSSRGSIFYKFMVLAIFAPLFQWLIHVNLWFVFIPFLMGVFIAKAKLLRKIFTLFGLDKKTE